ncbi:MAG: pirin family protein [Schleiferiaceae bacterium]|nr:pirin family protein [Schleiferiaceae bacterium]
MTQIAVIPAASRGKANHGWLQSYHSFSFAEYYNPNRMHFGALRVLNDDWVAPGKGFGTHPHSNMEIISIPLEGEVAHRDSMGNEQIIRTGDVQVMSAGTGVTHSEYNYSKTQPVKFLQIWIVPNVLQATPRYDQITLRPEDRENRWQTIIAPKAEATGLWIHQDTWFALGKFEKGTTTYALQDSKNGVYMFLLNGNCSVLGHELNSRDAVTITQTDSITVSITTPGTEILLMEVPLNL